MAPAEEEEEEEEVEGEEEEEEETRSDGSAEEFPAPAAGSPILHYGLIKDKHRRGLILCAETRSSLK